MPNRTVADVMVRRLHTLSPDDPVADAMQLFLKHSISGAPVVSESNELVGVLSEKDCLKVVADQAFHQGPSATVASYMSRNPATLAPEDRLMTAITRFLYEPYRRFPVVDDDGKVVGQLSRRDVLKVLVTLNEEQLGHLANSGALKSSATDTDELVGPETNKRFS